MGQKTCFFDIKHLWKEIDLIPSVTLLVYLTEKLEKKRKNLALFLHELKHFVLSHNCGFCDTLNSGIGICKNLDFFLNKLYRPI